jgi:hypothetical protein
MGAILIHRTVWLFELVQQQNLVDLYITAVGLLGARHLMEMTSHPQRVQ